MTDKIIERIIKNAEGMELMDFLTLKLSSSDLQSLLMEVYRRRIMSISPAQLLGSYEGNRFVKPSRSDPSDLLGIDSLALSLLPEGFTAMELSPVCPLGSCSVMALVDQNRLISAIRNTEVVADATNVLAMEAAVQRKGFLDSDPKSIQNVKLASSHRLIRTQPFDDERFSHHFRIFCLCTAGRDQGSMIFESENLIEHVRFYISMFIQGYSHIKFNKPEVLFTDIENAHKELLEKKVILPLSGFYPEMRFSMNPDRTSALNYYKTICFTIRIRDNLGKPYDIVDGGFSDWTQSLLNNRKERLLTSGIGTELLYRINGPVNYQQKDPN